MRPGAAADGGRRRMRAAKGSREQMEERMLLREAALTLRPLL